MGLRNSQRSKPRQPRPFWIRLSPGLRNAAKQVELSGRLGHALLMTSQWVAAIETGGTKLLARIVDQASDEIVAEGRWATSSPEAASRDLTEFLGGAAAGGRLAAVGMAAFGPLIIDPDSPDYGLMQSTTKPGWTGSNLRADLEEQLGAPVVVDSDVNAAAIAEQAKGAGQGLPSVAYVTIGTGIGAGLAICGQSLKGAMHPEAGHLPIIRRRDDNAPSLCRFHADCAEGLVSGAAIRRRLGEGRQPFGRPGSDRTRRGLSRSTRCEPGACLVAASHCLGRRRDRRRIAGATDRGGSAFGPQWIWSRPRARSAGILRIGSAGGRRA